MVRTSTGGRSGDAATAAGGSPIRAGGQRRPEEAAEAEQRDSDGQFRESMGHDDQGAADRPKDATMPGKALGKHDSSSDGDVIWRTGRTRSTAPRSTARWRDLEPDPRLAESTGAWRPPRTGTPASGRTSCGPAAPGARAPAGLARARADRAGAAVRRAARCCRRSTISSAATAAATTASPSRATPRCRPRSARTRGCCDRSPAAAARGRGAGAARGPPPGGERQRAARRGARRERRAAART